MKGRVSKTTSMSLAFASLIISFRLSLYQQPQNSPTRHFLVFTANRLGPLLFQVLETAARPMTKTMKHLESLLRFEKAGMFLVKLGLVKLLKAMQELLVGLGGINEDGPFTIADDKLMDGLVALNLTLSSTQPAKEGFQVIVGTVALGPGITLEEPPPALAEGRCDMRDHTGILGTVSSVLLQVGQKLFDPALDPAAG